LKPSIWIRLKELKEKVDVNFSAQKVHGTVDTPKTERIPQPTSW
jgi:hypothetical protein